ncbi:MAG: hypothetical protein Q9M94_07325 [Candidatus Gracilibacteria bacterium]|nr:hypothetical protein [Candidatus Gracilibacteria bacterium]MDQ7022837.1 hypothetical protein [Candidatus Gracilibacteria bacterium]
MEKNLTEKNIIALIPFIRNLIEYGENKPKDYMLLTHLLHKKNTLKYDKNKNYLKVDEDNNIIKGDISNLKIIRNYNEDEGDFEIKRTEDICFSDIEEIFKKYFGISEFNLGENINKKIYNTLNLIVIEKSNLEDKIILSTKIRYEAEKFMINKVSENFLNKISSSQTGELISKIKKGQKTNGITNKEIKILDSVNIMTPENIHLNSFMYEPILDMDIVELKRLYEKVKELNK